MKRKWLKAPIHYIITGAAGLLLSVVGLLLIEFAVSAPNAATLAYWQGRLTLLAIFLLILSAGFVVYGVTWRRQLRRYEDK